MGILLRLKHWHVFILTFGLFVMVIIGLTIFDFVQLVAGEAANTPTMFFRFIFLGQTICAIFANLWIFAIGTRLHQKRPYNSLMILIFRWSIYFSTLLHAARFVSFPVFYYFEGSFSTIATMVWLAGGLYCDYFAAKLLNSLEQDRDVPFREFAGDFFLFIFYPIGVWWLQPRINRIFGRDNPVFDPNTPLDQHVTN